MKADLLIDNAYIVTVNPEREIIDRGYVAVEGNEIIEIGEGSEPSISGEREIDGSNKVLLPGLINTHVHFYQNFIKGRCGDSTLFEWCDDNLFPFVQVMRREEREGKKEVGHLASLMACTEMIKSGCTCSVSYDFTPGTPEAISETGIRSFLGLQVADENIPDKIKRSTQENLDSIREIHQKWDGAADGRIRSMIAPSAPFNCSDELLSGVKKIADDFDIGITMHVLETKQELEDDLESEGPNILKRLEKLGLLDSDFLAVHCVWVDDDDIEILKRHNASVSYNPESNMRLGSGIAPISEMLEEGLTVGVATDGAASNDNLDMVEVMRASTFLQRAGMADPTVLSPQKTLEMATIDGARALGMEDEIGSIEVGKKADLILIDTMKTHLQPMWGPVSTIVFAANGADVDTTVVDGKVIMENREIKTVSEEEVMERGIEKKEEISSRAPWDGY